MDQEFNEIPTRTMVELIRSGEKLIIDNRSTHAFNGWSFRDEHRGGHIKGAVNFPFEWFKYHFELPEFLQAKGIIPDKPIVIYGYNPEETNNMAAILFNAGYNNIAVYHRFVDEWAANDELPMKKLMRYKHLIYPEWLKQLQAEEHPPTYEGNKFVVCHAHYDNIEDYREGHIPGAIDLNTLELEAPETWNCRTPEEIEAALLRHGIRYDTTVVLYGRFSYPRNEDTFPGKRAGQLAAMRCAAILMHAGVEDVRILNGSFLAWEHAGFGISTEPVRPHPEKDFGLSIPAHPEYIIGMEKAKKLLAAEDGELVSIRSWPEFTGEVSGYNYIEKKGRIPGAVFGNCGSDAYHMENYRNPDLTIRAAEELAANWTNAGITPDKHLAFYCGTGWRGSEAFMNAWLMGWPRVSVYDGGWMEWSCHPENPVETGIPEDAESKKIFA
ncbi:MAG: thiosulfate sulfurtransferase [Chlorobi bacterium]|nr:thiosulfate sulfurtransferase [Chlorobiota bacterium]